MIDMLHEVHVTASPDEVFRAISTEEGLKSWWTADTDADPREGSVATFGFYNRSTVFKMHIDKLEPGKRVDWTCQDGPDEWKQTHVRFELAPNAEGGTVVRFRHADWRKTDGDFARCNTTWGALMVRLKGYVEGVAPGPFFSG
ncbi:MAG: SRPBCC domain-containing protein [Acidiferrobacterales bacterium]